MNELPGILSVVFGLVWIIIGVHLLVTPVFQRAHCHDPVNGFILFILGFLLVANGFPVVVFYSESVIIQPLIIRSTPMVLAFGIGWFLLWCVLDLLASRAMRRGV